MWAALLPSREAHPNLPGLPLAWISPGIALDSAGTHSADEGWRAAMLLSGTGLAEGPEQGRSTTMSRSSRCSCPLDAAVLLRRVALQVVPGPLRVDPRHDLRLHEALGGGNPGAHRQHGVPGSHRHARPAACRYASSAHCLFLSRC